MMRKSHKRKKPPKDGGSWLLALGSWLLALGSWLLALGSWLVGIGTLLLGIAAICEVVFKIVVYLSGR